MDEKARAEKEAIDMLERAIRNLAQQRAMLMKLEIMNEEEITDFINEKGAKYGRKYDSMNPAQIMIEALGELAEMVEKERRK